MAQKKDVSNILAQSEDFIKGSSEREELKRMREAASVAPVPESDNAEYVYVKKKVTKAQKIKDLRPKQVSIHFTVDEKQQLDNMKYRRQMNGDAKATVEDIIHECVVKMLAEQGGGESL